MSLFSFSSSSSSLDRSTPARSPARERANAFASETVGQGRPSVERRRTVCLSRHSQFSDLLVVDCLSPDALELPYVSLDLACCAR
ncbi:unnamed protein product [Sphagnum troendelagicum]|uniref:Uncharacterized protein n=1 Tax=Sphagnum troendelagicum TaxID=128251 RepID=A0ABP0U919_9BRYO